MSNKPKWYVTEDHHSPTLTKNSLGNFMFYVLDCGGKIGDVWPFNYKYSRSSVYFSVKLTEEQKEYLETIFLGKIKFKEPTKVHLSNQSGE